MDDSTGHALDPKLVQAARADDMKSFKEMEVYVYVKRENARRNGDGKLVGVRWVDILKGDSVRSRLVAQEFAGKDERDDIFASTPPLTATKLILSDFSSKSKLGCGNYRLMVLDIKKAFLYSSIEDTVYIELPDEDP